MSILEAKGISKIYGEGLNFNAVHALRNTDLTIEEGTINVIIGRSGSGKSTLLHILGGLDEPTTGDVFLEGKSLYSLNRTNNALVRRRRIGTVFQFYNLLEDLTVYENIVLPIHLDGKKEDESYINELIEFLGLTEKKWSMIDTLSGGQQQRVAIARALATKPAILLCDEPTGNLDKKSGEEVIQLLLLCKHRFGQTIILVTHDLSITQIADRLLTIEDGVIFQDEKK